MSVKSRFPVCFRAMAVVMLFAMFHYVAGYRLMYSLGILYSKQEAKECMVEKNNIKKLTLSVSEYNSLKWSEANKEFSYHNEMYDVTDVQKSGDNYTITVYADSPETELIMAFHNFEKELFHPDQSSKSAKSAEDVMSSFQQDCTPASEFRMSIFNTGFIQTPDIQTSGTPLQMQDNIWHPPLAC